MKFIKNGYINYIKSNFNQVRIFSHYLNVSEFDIISSLESNTKVINNIRNENNPSIKFTYNPANNKIYAYDWGNPYYKGDFIAFAGFALNLNPNIAYEFVAICKDIINNVTDNSTFNTSVSYKKAKVRYKQFFKMNINTRNFNSSDINFWNQFGLVESHLKLEDVYAVSSAYKIEPSSNISKLIYRHKSNDPCYAYKDIIYDNTRIWKLYFPYRKKGQLRFYTNNKFPIESIKDINPKAEIAVIIKSKKDKMVTNNLIILNDEDISYYTLSSETARIKKDSKLGKILNNHPVKIIHADYDKAGFRTMLYYKNEFGAIPLSTMNSKYKDISDFVKKYGIEYVNKLLKTLNI